MEYGVYVSRYIHSEEIRRCKYIDIQTLHSSSFCGLVLIHHPSLFVHTAAIYRVNAFSGNWQPGNGREGTEGRASNVAAFVWKNISLGKSCRAGCVDVCRPSSLPLPLPSPSP